MRISFSSLREATTVANNNPSMLVGVTEVEINSAIYWISANKHNVYSRILDKATSSPSLEERFTIASVLERILIPLFSKEISGVTESGHVSNHCIEAKSDLDLILGARSVGAVNTALLCTSSENIPQAKVAAYEKVLTIEACRRAEELFVQCEQQGIDLDTDAILSMIKDHGNMCISKVDNPLFTTQDKHLGPINRPHTNKVCEFLCLYFGCSPNDFIISASELEKSGAKEILSKSSGVTPDDNRVLANTKISAYLKHHNPEKIKKLTFLEEMAKQLCSEVEKSVLSKYQNIQTERACEIARGIGRSYGLRHLLKHSSGETGFAQAAKALSDRCKNAENPKTILLELAGDLLAGFVANTERLPGDTRKILCTFGSSFADALDEHGHSLYLDNLLISSEKQTIDAAVMSLCKVIQTYEEQFVE